MEERFQSSFELTGYITYIEDVKIKQFQGGFKALSSLRVI